MPSSDALPPGELAYGFGWLRNLASVSLLSRAESFFFAWDDEYRDMACVAAGGELRRFAIRMEGCELQYSSERLSIVPIETEDTGLPLPLGAIAGLYEPNLTVDDFRPMMERWGVAVGTTRSGEAARVHGNALDLWPSGDPEHLVGLGSWDPFENLQRDLRVVFERVIP